MRFIGGGARRSKYEAAQDVEGRKHKPDFVILVLSFVLIALGMIVMYSISPAVSAISGLPPNYYFVRHFISFLIGLAGMVIIYNVKLTHLKRWSYVIAFLSVVTSGIILVVSGFAFRWLKVAGLSFQPAEMMKFGLIVWLGFFLATQKRRGEVGEFHKTLKPVLYVLASLAFIVALLQRDLGSMVVLAAIAGLMLFMSNVPMKTLMLVFLVLVALGGIAIASTPYRRDRFITFLNPERDCVAEGYHACQAIITVGSGGLFGLGVGNSVQAYGYLPWAPSDSIFAIYAEKFGFIGCMVFIALIGALLLRLLRVSSRTMAWEPRLIMIGIIAWVGVQSAINIGAMLGLLPLKGITLPFISYGGSSLIFVMLAIGVALRISCYTSVRKHELDIRGGEHHESTTIGRGNRRTYNTPFGSRS